MKKPYIPSSGEINTAADHQQISFEGFIFMQCVEDIQLQYTNHSLTVCNKSGVNRNEGSTREPSRALTGTWKELNSNGLLIFPISSSN